MEQQSFDTSGAGQRSSWQTHCLILPSTYRDSVALMALARTLEELPEVRQAAAMMGAPHNKAVLQEAALLTDAGAQASANDLLICVQAATSEAAERALREATQQLMHRRAVAFEPGEVAPRTLETALRRLPEANLAVISVPGQYAAHEARKALQHGLHVFLFSDHVPLQAESELKHLAAQHGVLLMGPDCGSAILNGVPLGFANQVPRGPIGLVSASGTGLQHVTCLLARHGVGISQALGVGGRDLHQQIGGASMLAALQALAADSATEVIVLLSKPPDAAVAARLIAAAARIGKPCVLAFLGAETVQAPTAALHLVNTLEDAAAVAGALAGGAPIPSASGGWPPGQTGSLPVAPVGLQAGQRLVRGLYCGGTLAYEALWLLRRTLGCVDSNLDRTYDTARTDRHVVLDLGAEEFTRGRPHPMIDPSVRRQHFVELAGRSDIAVVLCDVMLGWGVHADPASALVEAWGEIRAQHSGAMPVGIAVVCGTSDDPQGYASQCRRLREHGFLLADSNAQAVRLATDVIGARATLGTGPEAAVEAVLPPATGVKEAFPELPVRLGDLFATGPRVVNLGLELFAGQLTACGVPVVQVDWRPPAGGDVRLASMLERLR